MLPLLPPRLQSFRRNGANFTMLRLDEVHPFAGGNKLFKLKYNLEAARSEGHDTLLTFGGAFSNHIAATAAAAKATGFKSIGIIRGEETALSNPTLQFAAGEGMRFHFLSRTAYRIKDTAPVLAELEALFGRFYLVPEGGANAAGVRGCAEIPELFGASYSHIALACGTGTTLAGVAAAVAPGVEVIGFPVLKNGQFLEAAIETQLRTLNGDAEPVRNWSLQCDYHFGGYAKVPDALRAFKAAFETEHHIPLDYVYTAKMVYGVCDLAARGYFQADAQVLLIHTGGLQGNAGFDHKQ
jgi:1-aminocyclopropane-1-carboxylate deaminase